MSLWRFSCFCGMMIWQDWLLFVCGMGAPRMQMQRMTRPTARRLSGAQYEGLQITILHLATSSPPSSLPPGALAGSLASSSAWALMASSRPCRKNDASPSAAGGGG